MLIVLPVLVKVMFVATSKFSPPLVKEAVVSVVLVRSIVLVFELFDEKLPQVIVLALPAHEPLVIVIVAPVAVQLSE